jgi:hypothetical protein
MKLSTLVLASSLALAPALHAQAIGGPSRMYEDCAKTEKETKCFSNERDTTLAIAGQKVHVTLYNERVEGRDTTYTVLQLPRSLPEKQQREVITAYVKQYARIEFREK